MKLNLKNLCREFAEAKEAETTPTDGVNPYLLEEVLRPVLRGNSLTLRAIDYNQFEDDDISDLADYCERLEVTSRKLEQFVGAVTLLKAFSSRSRQFC